MKISPPSTVQKIDQVDHTKLRETSQKLEAQFLSIMLKNAGFEKALGNIGDSKDHSEFASFLIDEYAQSLAKTHDFGLAEKFYTSLLRTYHG